MASAVEDFCNQALRASGSRKRIADIYEGSPEARVLLEIYGQTRDEVLGSGEWPFARAAGIALTLYKGPPPPGGYNPGQPWTSAYPAPPFLYSYIYPADCINLTAILKPPASLPDLDPRPASWRIDNDPPQKVILTNVTNALAVYRRRVTNPTYWEPDFIATFVAALSRKIMQASGQNIQVQQAKGQETMAIEAAADRQRG